MKEHLRLSVIDDPAEQLALVASVEFIPANHSKLSVDQNYHYVHHCYFTCSDNNTTQTHTGMLLVSHQRSARHCNLFVKRYRTQSKHTWSGHVSQHSGMLCDTLVGRMLGKQAGSRHGWRCAVIPRHHSSKPAVTD